MLRLFIQYNACAQFLQARVAGFATALSSWMREVFANDMHALNTVCGEVYIAHPDNPASASWCILLLSIQRSRDQKKRIFSQRQQIPMLR